MPKITSFTPEWLCKGAPGHGVFAPSTAKKDDLPAKHAIRAGPRRTIARRGTSEIFVAVGKEIRWTDLAKLKDNWDSKTQEGGYMTGKSHGGGSDDDKQAPGWRLISPRTKVADDIRQLIMSPNEELMAVLTTHTVHIVVLPDSARLKLQDTGDLKVMNYTLGPFTHVTTQSAIASALWHPLGKDGNCLVTVTEESVVRVWELDLAANRKTLETPTLSIDLKKLVDGTSNDQDFSVSSKPMSNGFSPDAYDMEVASACFGERDSGGWSPMTLWIAMREGGVYALCPLLPEKWCPPPVLMASLSVSIVSKAALAKQDPDISDQEILTCEQQLEWMSDLDMQDPVRLGEDGAETEVYARPAKPGKVPKLQGPFDIDFQEEEEDDEEHLLSDILVIGAKLDSDELMFGEEDSLVSEEAGYGELSVNVVCLLASTGRVTICLDMDGVEAQWLPHRKSKSYHSFAVPEDPSLLAFQAVETLRPAEVDEESWPVFSRDCSSRYSFFVTSTSVIHSISLSDWVFRLESELSGSGSTNEGLPPRLANLVRGPHSARKQLYPSHPNSSAIKSPLAGSVVLRDPDLGYFLLSATLEGPIMISFDSPEFAENLRPKSPTPSQHEFEDLPQPGQLCEPRPVYQPPQALEQNSDMPDLLSRLRRGGNKRLMNEHVRLSPATLNVMTETHKVVSEESDRIREAAAELFRRCQRLQTELKDQIQKANEVARRVEDVAPSTPKKKEDGEEKVGEKKQSSNEIIQARIERAKEKEKVLMKRLEGMKKKLTQGNVKELSVRERKWIKEVNELAKQVHVNLDDKEDAPNYTLPNQQNEDENSDDEATVNGENGSGSPRKTITDPWKRYEEVKTLKNDLLEQAKKGAAEKGRRESGAGVTSSFGRSHMRVPSAVREAKMKQIEVMLDREQILVDNTRVKLQNLSI